MKSALDAGQPVVALESSVISQGLPRPRNLEAAQRCEEALREEGAVPATIAVLDGVVCVGLDRLDLERLANEDGIAKAAARDIVRVVAGQRSAATTVGATITIAAAAGIKTMATGGIGGVHRGFETLHDVSSDLRALAENPVVVVSSGFKSILDLPRTLEVLEAEGVPILGYRTSRLPDFYSVDSGFSVPEAEDGEFVARVYMAQQALRPRGIVVANPPPAEQALSRSEMSNMVENADHQAREAGVTGSALTPFLLSRIAELSGGRTVDLNIALLLSNTRVAATVDRALSAMSSGIS